MSLPLGFGPGPVCEAGDSLYSEMMLNASEPTEIFVYSSTQQCYDAASYTTLERVLCQRNPQECRKADPISMQDTLGHTAYARAGSVSRWERENWNEGSRSDDVRTASLPIKKSSFGSRMKEIFDLLMHEDMLSWYWEEATQGKMANFWQIFDGNDESLNVMCQRFDEQYASIAHLGVRTPTCPYSSAGAPSKLQLGRSPRLFIYARDRPEFNDEYRSTFLAAVADVRPSPHPLALPHRLSPDAGHRPPLPSSRLCSGIAPSWTPLPPMWCVGGNKIEEGVFSSTCTRSLPSRQSCDNLAL